MPHSAPVNWQPISEMPLIAGMIDEALDDTRAQIKTLTEASTRPHVMDDATVERIDSVYAEQMEFVDIYAEQIVRWRTETPSVGQTRELDRMEEQNRTLLLRIMLGWLKRRTCFEWRRGWSRRISRHGWAVWRN